MYHQYRYNTLDLVDCTEMDYSTIYATFCLQSDRFHQLALLVVSQMSSRKMLMYTHYATSRLVTRWCPSLESLSWWVYNSNNSDLWSYSGYYKP